MATANYDLVIIGAGSAGLTAASFAVQLGRRVALVEKDRIGGDCTWTGCVPSKALLKAARVAHEMRHADRYGLGPAEPAVDLKKIMARVMSVVQEVYENESPELLSQEGIDVVQGAARFLDPHTVAVGDAQITANRFLICTGAAPSVPPIPGLDGVEYWTYETIWNMEAMPEHLLVLGAGPVGCELAQAFCRLGARVTLLEAGSRILPNDEPEASEVITRQLAQDGVDVRLGAPVDQVVKEGDGIRLTLDGRDVEGDALLIAAGRRPRLDTLDLDKAGVAYSAQGIQVNGRLRTSRRIIFAAGDCIGGFQFTHYAGWQGFMAVRNAFLPGASIGVLDQVPWTTFTDPEVAHTGLTEAQARARHGQAVMVCNWPLDKVDRALAEGDTTGFVKLVHRNDGKLLGATIVAARAGEMIQELSLAIDRGLKIGDLANSMHVYPTYAMAIMQAAAHIRIEQLLSGTSGKVIRGLLQLTR